MGKNTNWYVWGNQVETNTKKTKEDNQKELSLP